jgi:hypothetical protein
MKRSLETIAKGNWQITKKAMSTFLKGSSITLIAKLPYFSAERIVSCVGGEVLSTAKSVFFWKERVFCRVFLPCFVIPCSLKWSFFVPEFALENAM